MIFHDPFQPELFYELGVHQDPEDFFHKATSQLDGPQYILVLFLHRHRTLHLPLLNRIRFLSIHFSSLLRSFWTAAQPSGV